MTYPNAWDTKKRQRRARTEPQQSMIVDMERFFRSLGGRLQAELRDMKELQAELEIPEPICPGSRAHRLIGHACAYGERRRDREKFLHSRRRLKEEALRGRRIRSRDQLHLAEVDEALKDLAGAMLEATEFCRGEESTLIEGGSRAQTRIYWSSAPWEETTSSTRVRRKSPDPIVIRLRRMSPERWRRWGGMNWRSC